MPRRKQKFSREKSRTMWLAWCAWAVMGSIFVFEDTQGGTGWLAWTMTAPFWIAFALWPFLWLRLISGRRPEYVEIDDDIAAGEKKCRLVQKEGRRYLEKTALKDVFGVDDDLETVKLPGGNEEFVAVDSVREIAKNVPALAAWIEEVDSIAKPRCYY